MDTLVLGPATIPMSWALLLAATAVTLASGRLIARMFGVSVVPSIWAILFVGISSARLAYLVVYWSNYANRPWAVFDLRDGGFNVAVGIAGALTMLVVLGASKRAIRIPLVVSVLAGFSVWGAATAALSPEPKREGLPDIELSDVNDKAVRIADFSGKPVVINLWATWCPPCRREMPVLRDAQRANPDVVFIFANQGEPGDTVKDYLQSERLDLENVLLDPRGKVAARLGSAGLPTTLFFDSNGNLVKTRVGAVSEGALQQLLRTIQRPGQRPIVSDA